MIRSDGVHGARPDLLRPQLDGHGGLVTWADMRSIGLNPARLIDTISLFARQHPGRVIWCVHEPAWSARTAEELCEVIRHEALVNLALAGLPVNVLCPYGIQLGTRLIASVERTHPELTQGGRRWPSSSYTASTIPSECDQPLSTPQAGAETLRYRDDLAGVRDFTTSRARQAGLPPRRVGDLVIAVGELAANTFAHTSGPGTLTLWATGSELICQVNRPYHRSTGRTAKTGFSRGRGRLRTMGRPASLRSGPDPDQSGWHRHPPAHAPELLVVQLCALWAHGASGGRPVWLRPVATSPAR